MRFSAFVALAAIAVQSVVAVKSDITQAAKADIIKGPPACGVSEPSSLSLNSESPSLHRPISSICPMEPSLTRNRENSYDVSNTHS